MAVTSDGCMGFPETERTGAYGWEWHAVRERQKKERETPSEARGLGSEAERLAWGTIPEGLRYSGVHRTE